MAQWAPWFNVSGGNANPGAPISVVARNPNHLDLFITSTGGVAFSGSPISVVARNPNHLDLFITSSDSHIYSTWWEQFTDQWASWFNVSSGVTASGSRAPPTATLWAWPINWRALFSHE